MIGIDKDDDVVLGAPHCFAAAAVGVRDRPPLFWRFFNPWFYSFLIIGLLGEILD